MDSAYVTRYNFQRLSGSWLQSEGDLSIDKIFSILFKQSLSDILNFKEAKRLYVQKQMLEGNLHSLRIVKKQFNQNYIFSVAPPKFHKKSDCEFLTADFKNYLVPPAIKVLGEDKVKEFQEFCESTKKEFEGKTEDVFWAHVGAKFRVHISPQSVLYENSGIQDVSKMSVEELRKQINEKLEDSLKMLQMESTSKILKNFRYAPYMQSVVSQISNVEVKLIVTQFFKLKIIIINSLFELYIPKQYRFSVSLYR